MKIHALGTKGSVVVKLYSLFPFIGFIFSLSFWFINKSDIIFLLTCLFCYLFIYTLFYAKHELYIDTLTKKVIKKSHWLFIKNKWVYPLADYKGIYISLGGCIAKSNYNSFKKKQTYNVVLVHKWASTDTAYSMSIMENFLLQTLITDIEEARKIAYQFNETLGIEVFIEKQIAKTNPNLLKYGKFF